MKILISRTNFCFVPSIGISEIIKIPNDFSVKWQDNYFVTSLMDNSLYRVKFSKNFDKIIFNEKIFIGQKIRDIKFNKKKIFILSLQDKSELGFYLQKITKQLFKSY